MSIANYDEYIDTEALDETPSTAYEYSNGISREEDFDEDVDSKIVKSKDVICLPNEEPIELTRMIYSK